MKLKTFLLAGLVTVAGATAASADSVYSVNAVGYVTVDVPANKFVLVGNPVSQPTNSLANIIPSTAPIGSAVFKYNGSGFSSFLKIGANSWTGNPIINPGEGFFIKCSTTTNTPLTFVGEVPTGTLDISIVTGYNLLSSAVPQSGKVGTDLSLPAAVGETVYRYNPNSGYSSFLKVGSPNTWVPSEPQVSVGEGFWIAATSSKTWSRVFEVNQ